MLGFTQLQCGLQTLTKMSVLPIRHIGRQEHEFQSRRHMCIQNMVHCMEQQYSGLNRAVPN